MSDQSSLTEIAKMLPPEQAERFLSLITRFKNVADDDEYLQILEAIGFMTLLWKEVPQAITTILEKANPITETCHTVSGHLREAVIEAIPSYDDLKSIVSQLGEHELALKRGLLAIQNHAPRKTPSVLGLVIFLVGIAGGIFLQSHFPFI